MAIQIQLQDHDRRWGGEAPYALEELSSYFRVNSFFIADNVRDIIQEGLGVSGFHVDDLECLFPSIDRFSKSPTPSRLRRPDRSPSTLPP